MNRRSLLKGVVALPIASSIAACRREGKPSATLRVILNGPFGVVIDRDNDYRITAYVPTDPNHEHELRFRGPAELAGSESKDGKPPNYHYELLPEGLDVHRGNPRVDAGLYDFNFPHIGNWKLPSEYLVAIDLPTPDAITFIPPAEPVVFGGSPTLQPLNFLIEYRMRDPDDVNVKFGEKKVRPMPCSELLKQYRETPNRTGNQKRSQHKNIEEMLESCSPPDLCLLFGVGFNPDKSQTDPEGHGIDFFNNVLLPSLFPTLKQRLQKIGACGQSEVNSSPMLMPAVFRYPDASPRLLQVTSIADCDAGGALGHRP